MLLCKITGIRWRLSGVIVSSVASLSIVASLAKYCDITSINICPVKTVHRNARYLYQLLTNSNSCYNNIVIYMFNCIENGLNVKNEISLREKKNYPQGFETVSNACAQKGMKQFFFKRARFAIKC